MSTGMVVAAGGTTKGDFDERKKRNRQVEKEKSVDIFERVIRDGDCIEKLSFNDDFDFDPPWITKFLDFTLDIAMVEVNDLATKIKNGVVGTEMEKCTGELAKLVHQDPRLCDHLQQGFLTLLVDLLENKQNPKVKSHAAIVLQYVVLYSKYKEMIIEYIATNTSVVNLIRSENCEVQMQALCLLRNIALAMPESSQIIALLEEALTPITSLLLDDSTNLEVYFRGSETLAVTCQLYPQLPDEKLESVLNALVELLEYDSVKIVPYGCFGLAYLCHARKKMLIRKELFEDVVESLLGNVLCFNCERVMSIAAVTALGAIVRWGSCSDIEVIIEKNELRWIQCCLDMKDKWFVKNGCWIVSNIIAKTENHIKDVLRPRLIGLLVSIVEYWKLLGVKKEAAWAISNAVFGAEPSEIEGLKQHLVKPLWSLVQSLYKVQEIVSICLRALIRLEAVEVTCNGRPIDLAKIKKYLVRLQGSNTQLTEDVLWLAKLKKLRHADDSIKKSDGKMVFKLTVKIQEEVQYPQIILVYDSLEDVLMYIWGEDSIDM